VYEVPLSGSPRVLISPSRISAPSHVSWSPRGDAIAFINPGTFGTSGAVYVAQLGAVPLDPVIVVPASADKRRTIPLIAWSPDASSIFYSMASSTGDITLGGDLFRIPAAGGVPSLVAGSARGGPVAAIRTFRISPTGSAIAYVVAGTNGEGSLSESLWVEAVDGKDATRLEVPAGENVLAVRWTADGLFWATVPVGADQSSITLFHANPDATSSQIYKGPSIQSATPEASPAATPVASPIASPSA
jgi:hypothetical protein